jgi:hypothetical protein
VIVPFGDFPGALEWLTRIRPHGRALFPGKYPRRLIDLHAVSMFRAIDAPGEIA